MQKMKFSHKTLNTICKNIRNEQELRKFSLKEFISRPINFMTAQNMSRLNLPNRFFQVQRANANKKLANIIGLS